jgi:putative hydrolase
MTADEDELPRFLAEELHRIGYVLERIPDKRHQAQAFHRAARTIKTRDASELRWRSEAGALDELPGVGRVIASVVGDLIRTGETSYVEKLPVVVPKAAHLEGLAQRLMQALKGDCHLHSEWSDGAVSVEEMAVAARDLGHEYIVLTDHSPSLTIARGLSRERLESQLLLIDELNAVLGPFRILTGIECDILLDGSLDLDEDLLARLDVVVGSVHSKLRQPGEEMTARMLRAIENPHLDILGHCTGRIVTGRGRPQSKFDAHAVFEACARNGVAVEVNSRPERLDPPHELLRIAIDKGCYFSIDSDAHTPGQLAWQDYGCEHAAIPGVQPERVINTLGADDLLDWIARSARV